MSKGPVPPEFVITQADERAIREGYYYDQNAVEKVLGWFRLIRLTSGKLTGKPMEPMPWQAAWLARLYGWKMPDGRRRHRVAYLEACKKSSKTSMLAALALMMVLAEPSAEVYNGAVTGDQAGYLFREAAKMVKASPGLEKYFKINYHQKIITSPSNFGRMEALTSQADSKDGFNSSCTIFDEIHRWGSDQRLYDVMKEAGVARDNPLILMISTAGDDSSVFCRKIHDKAQAIIAGDDSDLTFLPQIYAASPEDDIDDPRTWYKANPSLGIVTKEDDFRQSLAEAKKSPAELAKFKRLRLGIWGTGSDGWIDSVKWRAGERPGLRDLGWWKGRSVIVAIDLSKGDNDLTALSVAATEGPDVYLRSHVFIPADNIARMEVAHGVEYARWADEGYIERTPGNMLCADSIVDHLKMLRKEGIRIDQVVLDDWYSIGLQPLLAKAGFNIATFPQNIRYFALPCVEFDRRLTAGKLKHCGSPVAEMCVTNARTKSDAAGNYMLNKGKDAKKKIDLAVSGVMAVGVVTSRKTGIPQVH